jgi:hypothetical protein
MHISAVESSRKKALDVAGYRKAKDSYLAKEKRGGPKEEKQSRGERVQVCAGDGCGNEVHGAKFRFCKGCYLRIKKERACFTCGKAGNVKADCKVVLDANLVDICAFSGMKMVESFSTAVLEVPVEVALSPSDNTSEAGNADRWSFIGS